MYMFLAFIYIVTVHCHTWFSMCQLRCHQIESNYNYLKFLVNVTNYYAAQLCDFNGQHKCKKPDF